MTSSVHSPAVARFHRMPIFKDEDGYYWQEGGYCDTLEEIHEEILAWEIEDQENDPSYEAPLDTPSVTPWWAER